MGTLIGTRSTANPSPASPTDEMRPRITTYPDGLADLIAETLRLRAMCVTISQTIIFTRDLVEGMRRNYISLLKLCRVQRSFINPTPPLHGDSSSARDGALARWGGTRPELAHGTRRRSEASLARSRQARAIERARLAGALLLARTAAHFVNNDLTSTVILDQMIRTQIERGERIDTRLLDDAIAAAKRAARHLIQLQRITRLEVQPGYGDSPAVLDLRLSHVRKAGGGRGSGSITAPRRRHRRHR